MVMKKLINLKNRRFGKLKVLEYGGADRRGNGTWICLCDCGNKKKVMGRHLRSGATKSCGCYMRESSLTRSTKHGHCTGKTTVEYRAYINMINRCYYYRGVSYRNYGGRGITVCKRWREGESSKSGFVCFLEDMGKKPDPKLTLERINNEKGYSTENCKWATRSEQCLNTRRSIKNKPPAKPVQEAMI